MAITGNVNYEAIQEEMYKGYAVTLRRNEKVLEELTPAQRVTYHLLHDITGRRGWRQEWDQFDADIQEEIFKKFVKIIEKEYKK